MNTHTDYNIAIETIATKYKRFYELTEAEKSNLIYLFARDKFVTISRDENLRKVLLDHYCRKTDLETTSLNLFSIIHDKIITEISLDLDDQISDLRKERIHAFPDFFWHPEDNIYFDNDDDWRQQRELEEQQWFSEYQDDCQYQYEQQNDMI